MFVVGLERIIGIGTYYNIIKNFVITVIILFLMFGAMILFCYINK